MPSTSLPAAALSPAARRANPMHCGGCAPAVGWSTINAGEALPGVVTPLTWSVFGDGVERSMRGAFCDLGVLASDAVPARVEERLWALFYGRAAGNLETFRRLGDRTPGSSGDAVEEQIFGSVRAGRTSEPTRRRYPVVAVRMPWAAARVGSRLRAATSDIHPWWQRSVAAAPADPRQLFAEANARFEAVMRPHTLAAMLCQALYEQVRRAAQRAGLPGLETSLITGYGDMAETAVVRDLWDVSRDRLTLDAFLRRHGFHGPNEGEMAARVWRLDPSPLERLLRSYRAMGDEREPRLLEAGRAAARRDAEARLLAATPRARRAATRLLLAVAARLIPLRGVGKASFLQCNDVMRAAAHTVGARLAADGVLAGPHDVFLLTREELLAAAPPAGLPDAVAERRAVRDEYRAVVLPELWEGMPQVRPGGDAPPATGGGLPTVTGTPVSPGVVEGLARVVVDPEGDEELEDGEVLVCRTTDPSWASLMMVASALVIDIGGAISHGAIVARELGIPCVIGTRDGSALLRTGDRLRVDADRGEVVVLERPA
ncbi:MAG TPA: PEP-utilizing enzyme [Baekduia sp.]|nr:PEP-utilizing enzyme [Baekduia sp.]